MSNCDKKCLLTVQTSCGFFLFTTLFIFLSVLIYKSIADHHICNFTVFLLILLTIVSMLLAIEVSFVYKSFMLIFNHPGD